MQKIEIKAEQFFGLLKLKDTSMWEIFAQMISENEKEIIFLDNEGKILFNYILPQDQEKLEEDRKEFSKQFADKLSNLN
jgi:predicted HicB family RNase H-like nuclease